MPPPTSVEDKGEPASGELTVKDRIVFLLEKAGAATLLMASMNAVTVSSNVERSQPASVRLRMVGLFGIARILKVLLFTTESSL